MSKISLITQDIGELIDAFRLVAKSKVVERFNSNDYMDGYIDGMKRILMMVETNKEKYGG